MKEHDHATIHKPETKPAHDEGGKKAHGADLNEGPPQGREVQNSLKADSKMPHTGPEHHAHMLAAFRKRFWVSLVLTLPILVLSPMLQMLVGLREAIRFPGDVYVLFGLSSAVFWYGGWPFHLTDERSLFAERSDPHRVLALGIAWKIVALRRAAEPNYNPNESF